MRPRAMCSVVRPTDAVSIFAPLFAAAGVEWMVSGGVAAILYGEPRLTQDIDVVVAMLPRDAMRFAQQFPETDFYCPPVEVIAQETERDAFGHFNVLHLASDARADVYMAGNDILARQGLATKRVVELVGHEVPIASPEQVMECDDRLSPQQPIRHPSSSPPHDSRRPKPLADGRPSCSRFSRSTRSPVPPATARCTSSPSSRRPR